MADDFEESSMGDLSNADGEEEEPMLSFTPVLKMPTSRLQDILDSLTTKNVGVVNLDAIVPTSPDLGVLVLQTMLHFIKVCVVIATNGYLPMIF